MCFGGLSALNLILKQMKDLEDLLEEFIDWARDCGEDAFYIFEETEEAIKKFFEQRED
jgi:hypothetical protein